MVKKVKQKKEGNAPPEKVVVEKLQGVLMWVLKAAANVFLGVNLRVQTVLGRSKKES